MNAIKLKKAAKGCARRPILQCINYDGKYATFTNSYFLVREEQKVGVEKPININLVNMKIMLGTYPEVEKIIVSKEQCIKVDSFKLVIDINKKLYVAENKNNEIKMNFSKEQVEMACASLDVKPFSYTFLNNLYLTKEPLPKLIYENEGQYALILGVRTND